jgi:hypothetical protein
MAADPNSARIPVTSSGPRFWRNLLLLTSSAAFGGLAVVLWNRRVLTQMRDQKGTAEERAAHSALSAEDEIF